jgi:hypothetical protein
MNDRPLWPEDGIEYDIAMLEAQVEYDRWVNSRKGGNGNRKGITVYKRKATGYED